MWREMRLRLLLRVEIQLFQHYLGTCQKLVNGKSSLGSPLYATDLYLSYASDTFS